MEKQPIDDLFHRKLHDAEVTPGADAFARLQSRIDTTPLSVERPRRRFAGWWYGATAACLLLTLAWSYQDRDVHNDVPEQSADKVARQGASKPRLTEPTSQPAVGLPDQRIASALPAPQPAERTQLVRAEEKGVSTGPTSSIDQRAQPGWRRDQVLAVDTQPSEATAQPQRLSERTTTPDGTSTNSVAAGPSSADRPPTAERVVVLLIDVPEQTSTVSTEAVARAAVQPATTTQPGWSQLVAKVKQLKNGELLARAAPSKPATEPRAGISRLFSNVKESLRNENTLEP